ncbi:MAG: hypothetical protein INR71_13050, partial [Terriglobus roseus]|nr:hypothetical protein [Terriglobus roseus]
MFESPCCVPVAHVCVGVAITASLSSPPISTGKHALASPGKRPLAMTVFDESEDAENIDPALLNSPSSKRSKAVDGTPVKPVSRFILDPVSPSASKRPAAVSLSMPTTTTATPISASRGSPRHKRVGLLARSRRASSSPFRRIDPPSTAGGLPFSIDEALKGSIPGYHAPAPVKPVEHKERHMPKGWFFDIHEDTPEQEAANLMEHSAATLDISSDDDDAARHRRGEDRERGKENVPPPDHNILLNNNATAGIVDESSSSSSAPLAVAAEQQAKKTPRGRKPK